MKKDNAFTRFFIRLYLIHKIMFSENVHLVAWKTREDGPLCSVWDIIKDHPRMEIDMELALSTSSRISIKNCSKTVNKLFPPEKSMTNGRS